VKLTLGFCGSSSFEEIDRRLVDGCAARPRAPLQAVVVEFVPAAVAAALIGALRIEPSSGGAELTRASRRELAHALARFPLPVIGTRGYNYAEATAGGVPLTEVHARTLESRICQGLWFAGEVLDVDGRLGGFNFQWAWSSAMTVARSLAGGGC
jgi:predicted flavoprotein YhiN